MLSTQTVTEEQRVSEEVRKEQIETDGDVVVVVQDGAG